jgi:ribosome-binding factor A
MQRSVADILRSEIRDPRVGMPNINAVKVPNDLSVAKVYVTFIGMDEPEQIDEAIAVLNDAAGYIRTLVAKEMKMRTVPRIYFVFDRVAVEGQRLANLIDAAVASDRKRGSVDEDEE